MSYKQSAKVNRHFLSTVLGFPLRLEAERSCKIRRKNICNKSKEAFNFRDKKGFANSFLNLENSYLF